MRRRKAEKRVQLPDVKYNSPLIGRLINTILSRGKKSTAQRIVYGALDLIAAKKPEVSAIEVFLKALDNVKPELEVKSRRVGGATYQVPIEVRPDRRQTLGLRWLTNYSRGRSENTMKERLAAEILDAANGTGASVKKRDDVHKMAEANKAFAHFRW